MSPREKGLRAGHKEFTYIGEFQLVLYWEAYATIHDVAGRHTIKHGFTVDRNHVSHRQVRVRYDTLEEADKAIATIKDELAISIAKQAFGLH